MNYEDADGKIDRLAFILIFFGVFFVILIYEDNWGVKVLRVELKEIRLPINMQRVMALEAEASHQARAKVIAAEAEKKAMQILKTSAEVIAKSPIALQLRYLQTLTIISAEKNSTIVFPVSNIITFLKFSLRKNEIYLL